MTCLSELFQTCQTQQLCANFNLSQVRALSTSGTTSTKRLHHLRFLVAGFLPCEKGHLKLRKGDQTLLPQLSPHVSANLSPQNQRLAWGGDHVRHVKASGRTLAPTVELTLHRPRVRPSTGTAEQDRGVGQRYALGRTYVPNISNGPPKKNNASRVLQKLWKKVNESTVKSNCRYIRMHVTWDFCQVILNIPSCFRGPQNPGKRWRPLVDIIAGSECHPLPPSLHPLPPIVGTTTEPGTRAW